MSRPTDIESTIPVVEEAAHVIKRAIETDRVRVSTVVEERRAILDAELTREELQIDRRPMELEVAEAPLPREEDGCLIISVVEERAVVEKRLFVVEEVRIRTRAYDESVQLPTTLRATRAIVERLPSGPIREEARE